ncbi:MAG: hypothetical protein Q9170_006422 [Blastenia crenularia]
MCDCWADLNIAECSQCTHRRLEAQRRARFSDAMRKALPQEIVDQIEDWVYEMTFCSGHIYPCSAPAKNKTSNQQPNQRPEKSAGYRSNLLTVSKRVLDLYQPRMRAENTWVIGPGTSDVSLKFMSTPEFEKAKGYIRRLHVSFSIRDLDTRSWTTWRPEYRVFAKALAYWEKYDISAEEAANHTFPNSDFVG